MDDYKDQMDFEYLPKRDRDYAWLAICAAIVLLGVLIGFSALANAQQRDPLQVLSLDWQSLVTAQGHVATGIQDMAQAYQAAQKKIADMDAYLKACADHVGCTVPAPEAK